MNNEKNLEERIIALEQLIKTLQTHVNLIKKELSFTEDKGDENRLPNEFLA